MPLRSAYRLLLFLLLLLLLLAQKVSYHHRDQQQRVLQLTNDMHGPRLSWSKDSTSTSPRGVLTEPPPLPAFVCTGSFLPCVLSVGVDSFHC